MSDDRVNVACPYCGEVYNLLASSVGNWWKCRNDQCRRGFEVENPSGGSPTTDRDTKAETTQLAEQANTEIFSSGEPAKDGIISLDAHVADDSESHSYTEAVLDAGTSVPLQVNQEQPPFQPDDPAESSSPQYTAQNNAGIEPQELDAFIEDDSPVGEVPGDDSEEFPSRSTTSGNSGLPELDSYTEGNPTFLDSRDGTDDSSADQRDSSTTDSVATVIAPVKPALTKKEKLQRRMKWIAATTLLMGAGIVVAIIIFRPQPNEVTDWADAVRLYEEEKWSKAKRSFARYNDNFPESQHSQEIPFFIDMCKAGADIFSRTEIQIVAGKAYRQFTKTIVIIPPTSPMHQGFVRQSQN